MLLAIIPARGGSKGVKNKNLRKIGNKSLVQITTDYSKSEREINRTIVSTDVPEVVRDLGDENSEEAFVSLDCGSILQLSESLFVHKRRSEHAGDNSPTIDTIQDVLTANSDSRFDSLLLLQPTSPFREKGEVKRVIETLAQTETNSCVSAKLFDSPHPSKAFSLNSKGLLEAEKFQSLSIPRQQLETLYVFDGAFYLTRVESIKKHNSLLSASTSIYLREGPSTLNIDNEDDMTFAIAWVNFLEGKMVS